MTLRFGPARSGPATIALDAEPLRPGAHSIAVRASTRGAVSINQFAYF